jgi:hypothetical protein
MGVLRASRHKSGSAYGGKAQFSVGVFHFVPRPEGRVERVGFVVEKLAFRFLGTLNAYEFQLLRL